MVATPSRPIPASHPAPRLSAASSRKSLTTQSEQAAYAVKPDVLETGRYDGFDYLVGAFDSLACAMELLMDDIEVLRRRDRDRTPAPQDMRLKEMAPYIMAMPPPVRAFFLDFFGKSQIINERLGCIFRELREEEGQRLAQSRKLGDKFALSADERVIRQIGGEIERILEELADKPTRRLLASILPTLRVRGQAIKIVHDYQGRIRVGADHLPESTASA